MLGLLERRKLFRLLDEVASAPTLAYGAELVTNGGAELDSGWSDYMTPTTNERSVEQVHGGTYSRKLVTDAGYEGVGVTVVATPTAGAWGEAVAWSYAVSQPLILVVQNKQPHTIAANVTPASTWAQAIGTTRFDSSGGALTVQMRSANATTYYVDDVSVRYLTLASLLTGGGDVRRKTVWAEAACTVTADFQAGVIACLDSAASPANYLHAYVDRTAAKVYLLKVVAGTTTALVNGAITYGAAKKVSIDVRMGSNELSDAQVRLSYDGVQIGATQTVDLSTGFGSLVRAFRTRAADTVTLTVTRPAAS